MNPYYFGGQPVISKIRALRASPGCKLQAFGVIQDEIVVSKILQSIPEIFPGVKRIIDSELLQEVLSTCADQRQVPDVLKKYSRFSENAGVFVSELQTIQTKLLTIECSPYDPHLIYMKEFLPCKDCSYIFYRESLLDLSLVRIIELREGFIVPYELEERYCLNPLIRFFFEKNSKSSSVKVSSILKSRCKSVVYSTYTAIAKALILLCLKITLN